MNEHQLFISHQAAFDVLWDRLRPMLLAADEQTRHLHPFIANAMKAGAMASGVAAAAARINAMRKDGLV